MTCDDTERSEGFDDPVEICLVCRRPYVADTLEEVAWRAAKRMLEPGEDAQQYKLWGNKLFPGASSSCSSAVALGTSTGGSNWTAKSALMLIFEEAVRLGISSKFCAHCGPSAFISLPGRIYKPEEAS